VKAYTTAVGAGPFPVELDDDTGRLLRERGGEYGATTGRARRVGWFDAVATRYARRINGFTRVAVTKLDVLDGLESIRICRAYAGDGTTFDSVPDTWQLEEVRPVYEDLPGWRHSTSDARSWGELPLQARRYLERIEELVGAPVGMVSVGPARDQTIVRPVLVPGGAPIGR
jgi:adenylosuccinate synthase